MARNRRLGIIFGVMLLLAIYYVWSIFNLNCVSLPILEGDYNGPSISCSIGQLIVSDTLAKTLLGVQFLILPLEVVLAIFAVITFVRNKK